MRTALIVSLAVNVALTAGVVTTGVTGYQLAGRIDRLEDRAAEPGPRGPRGPAGPVGPAGPAGLDGLDGADGFDGTDGVSEVRATGCLLGQRRVTTTVVTDVGYGFAFDNQLPPLSLETATIVSCS